VLNDLPIRRYLPYPAIVSRVPHRFAWPGDNLSGSLVERKRAWERKVCELPGSTNAVDATICHDPCRFKSSRYRERLYFGVRICVERGEPVWGDVQKRWV
jgi:hypothetical protein